MKIRFSRTPTFTKAIIASAIFTIAYLASTSNLPSCNDPAAILSSGGECIERQSFLHTASGWLALSCLVAAAALLVLKHKNSILGLQAPVQQSRPAPPAQAQAPVQAPVPAQGQAPAQRQAQAPVPVPARASNFCIKCGTRIIAGDRFCQGCGVQTGSPQI